MNYGYARVSTKDQNADRQIAALMEHGVKRDNIYIDKQSGKDFDRTYYKKLLRKLKPGDVFVVESMDRIGRNYRDNLDQYKSIEDFSGKVVGAQSGTTKADIITNDMPGAVPNLMTNVNDLVNNLVYDKCDAVVLDGAVAMQYVQTNDQLAIVEAVPLGEALPYCVWVAKDDPKGLLPSINETIAKVLADGSMDSFIAEADSLADQALE